ncbi:MAG: type VI secretion system baseplate subunit TssG [Vicinamibacterales bacterium]
MDATVGRETDAVAFLAALAEAPYRYDFYQTLRRIECLYDTKPRWGEALRPVDEPVRLGQEPDLSFAPAPLASFEAGQEGRPPRLQVRLFGLLGPNGPLPLHITEYARERLRHAADPTLSRFLDLFNHRFLTLFYRAWAQAQPHVNRDRPGDDHFAAYIGAFLGISPSAFRDRDTLPDLAKFFHVGTLIRQSRNPEGLTAILEQFFRVPVRIQEFVGHWMFLSSRECTYLSREGATLGSGAALGSRVWDRQNKFQIRLGPLSFAQYKSFLPGGLMLRKLVDWVRLYLSFELDWDVRLLLKQHEVPLLRLGDGRAAPKPIDSGLAPPKPRSGEGGRLGWTTWLGRRRRDTDADDLCLMAEAFVARTGASTA